MAYTQIGGRTVDWDDRADIAFQPVELDEGKGYLFFLEVVGASQATTLQYANVTALFTTEVGEIETPLLAKFFPKGRVMGFSVAVPKLSYFKDVECRIVLTPREFYPKSGPNRSLNIRLLWEDKEDFDADSVPLFAGI